jgi:hypothetical protein
MPDRMRVNPDARLGVLGNDPQRFCPLFDLLRAATDGRRLSSAAPGLPTPWRPHGSAGAHRPRLRDEFGGASGFIVRRPFDREREDPQTRTAARQTAVSHPQKRMGVRPSDPCIVLSASRLDSPERFGRRTDLASRPMFARLGRQDAPEALRLPRRRCAPHCRPTTAPDRSTDVIVPSTDISASALSQRGDPRSCGLARACVRWNPAASPRRRPTSETAVPERSGKRRRRPSSAQYRNHGRQVSRHQRAQRPGSPIAQPLEMSWRSSGAKDSRNAPAGSASCGVAPPG